MAVALPTSVMKTIGRAMAESTGDHNDRSRRPTSALLDEIDDLTDQLAEAREIITALRAQLAENVNSSVQDFAGQVNINGRRLVPASVYARQHGVSVPTVNRALRAGRLLGKQQENKRWLVVADAPITKSGIRRGRRSKVA